MPTQCHALVRTLHDIYWDLRMGMDNGYGHISVRVYIDISI